MTLYRRIKDWLALMIWKERSVPDRKPWKVHGEIM